MINNEIKFEEGYEVTYNKKGEPLYYKLENGKKKRISATEALKHLITEKPKKVRRGRRIVKEEPETEVTQNDIPNDIVDENEEIPFDNVDKAVESTDKDIASSIEIEQVKVEDIPTEGMESVAKESIVTAGDKECYLYFDMKLTENTKNASIISIAVTNCDGKTFYGEFNDFVKTDKTNENDINGMIHPKNTEDMESGNWTITGNRDEIKEKLLRWIDTYTNKDKFIQFTTDNAPFKFVMLMDLFNYEVSDNVSQCCVDLNQDIATSIIRIKPIDITEEEFNSNFVPVIEAYHVDRINYVMNSIEDIEQYRELIGNTSLLSALLIKSIHQFLWNL